MDQFTSRNKTINDKYEALIPENILCCNPAPEVTPEDISIILNSLTAEKEIADIYALVHNKAWWMEDDLYDFNETSQQYLELRKTVNLWFALEDRVEEVVFDILDKEGLQRSKDSRKNSLWVFMSRNGYRDGRGWWFPLEDVETNQFFAIDATKRNSYTHEFQKGIFDGETFNKIDSLFMDDNVLYSHKGFEDALYTVLRNFNSFNEVVFTRQEWNQIFALAVNSDTESRMMAIAANNWMKIAFAENNYVTLIGL